MVTPRCHQQRSYVTSNFHQLCLVRYPAGYHSHVPLSGFISLHSHGVSGSMLTLSHPHAYGTVGAYPCLWQATSVAHVNGHRVEGGMTTQDALSDVHRVVFHRPWCGPMRRYQVTCMSCCRSLTVGRGVAQRGCATDGIGCHIGGGALQQPSYSSFTPSPHAPPAFGSPSHRASYTLQGEKRCSASSPQAHDINNDDAPSGVVVPECTNCFNGVPESTTPVSNKEDDLSEIVEVLRLAIPLDHFIQINDVYVALAVEHRAIIKRHTKSLSRFLATFPEEFLLSADRCMVRCRGAQESLLTSLPSEDGSNAAGLPHQQRCSDSPHVAGAVAKRHGIPPAPVYMPSTATHPTAARSSSTHPTPNNATNDDLRPRWKDVVATAFSTQMLVSFIPTFFVPVFEVLPLLPEGYTESHLREYFVSTTKSIQMVTIAEVSYVRLHGGGRRAQVLLNTSEAFAIREQFGKYYPRLELCDAFVPLFGRVGEWVGLSDILSRASPEAVARLPYQGPTSLLFFAQRQHMFAFSPARGGGLALPPYVRHLTWDSTPVPLVCNELWNMIEGNPMPAEIAVRRLSSTAREELRQCFLFTAEQRQRQREMADNHPAANGFLFRRRTRFIVQCRKCRRKCRGQLLHQ